MRQTLSDLIVIGQNGAGKDTSTATKTFLKQRINARYENVLSLLPSYMSESTRTFATVADQQYYHYPPQMRRVESLVITIGSKDYPLTPVTSQMEWDRINSIDIQAGAIPTLYFNRQRDFGIYPVPQDAYTGTIVYNFRGSGMTREDYTTGTVTTVANDATVEGSGTTWNSTANVVPDMWFSEADTNGESRGSWYRVLSVTDADTLELETVWEETAIAGSKYIIGECPELPEEGHELLAFGAIADYFAMLRQDPGKAQNWNNMYWTGDWDKSTRDHKLVEGGLIGLIKRYRDRNDTQLIQRKRTAKASDKIWAQQIS